MNWTEKQIHFIIKDLIEENPLACRALFQVSKIVFTEKVDTMAVSISSSPVLFINLRFCRKYLETEYDVKAVLLHEFLHVLLLHTVKYKCNSPLLNICLDAIINAIIFRNQGMEYAGFFTRFYKWEKISFLLRTQCDEEPLEKEWMDIHKKIYDGGYCADDLFDLLEYLRSKMNITDFEKIIVLGNHENQETVSKEVDTMLDNILQKMNGVGIWSKNSYGNGNNTDKKIHEAEKNKYERWDATTIKILKRLLVRDNENKRQLEEQQITTPVLTGNDKRSLSKFIWSGLIPFSNHPAPNYHMQPSEKAHVYLDVSGSMDKEIGRLASLLFHFRGFIKRPLWVFSDSVKEAFFKGKKLTYDTSYGTRIDVVFDHMRKNKISKALIVTDGYVDRLTENMLDKIDWGKIHVLLSAEGNASEFENSNIPYMRLDKID